MNLKVIQFRKTALFLILLYVLGYTHFFGVTFWLARFLFVIILSGSLLSFIFTYWMLYLTKKIIKKNQANRSASGGMNETIKVESKVIE